MRNPLRSDCEGDAVEAPAHQLFARGAGGHDGRGGVRRRVRLSDDMMQAEVDARGETIRIRDERDGIRAGVVELREPVLRMKG